MLERLTLFDSSAVLVGVVFGGFPRMVRGVKAVSLRNVGVMRGFLVIAGFVMFGSFAMVSGSVLVVLRCFLVVFCALMRAHSK